MFFKRLKQYMPRGLYGRAVLILLLPVVTLQLLVSVVFIQRHFEGVTELMTRSILLELNYLIEIVDIAPDATTAQSAATDVGQALKIGVTFDPDPATIPTKDQRAFYDLSGRVLIRMLRADLGTLKSVDLSDYRMVRFWVDLPKGLVEIRFSRDRVSASNPHQLIVIMVVMGALMTLISYFFLRNQLRPIMRLAAASTEFGKGRVVPFSPAGAAEVRAAGTAFLDMRARIERQSQSRTMMLSGISHDLRTPLTRLRLALSMMDEAEAGPLINDVADMEHLVDGFLDFARTDALDDMVATDPVALLQQAVADAGRAGQAVTLGQISGAGAECEKLPLRPMALRRSLDNLIGNALRYGSRAVVSLHLTERALRFVVEDDGPGIPADQRDEAMRPFTRLDPARNQDKGSGVGLGLAIVADIARLHGGSLRLGISDTLGGLKAELVLAR